MLADIDLVTILIVRGEVEVLVLQQLWWRSRGYKFWNCMMSCYHILECSTCIDVQRTRFTYSFVAATPWLQAEFCRTCNSAFEGWTCCDEILPETDMDPEYGLQEGKLHVKQCFRAYLCLGAMILAIMHALCICTIETQACRSVRWVLPSQRVLRTGVF